MSIIGWIILGGISGWIAAKIVEGKGRGIIVNIAVGLLGALLGGFILSAIGGQGVDEFNIWSFVVAIFGAVVLLFILNGFKRTPKSS